MSNFLTEGKEKCRRLWLQHSKGNVLLLSAEDMSDALDLARYTISSITCPESHAETHWKKLTALREATLSREYPLPIRIVEGDFKDHVDPRIETYIPDLMVGWCVYTQQLISKICEVEGPTPTILFLTLTKYQPHIARFGTSEQQQLFMSSKRRLHTIRPALEKLIRDCGCIAVPIEDAIFEYHGTPQKSKALKGPNMIHLGYKLMKLHKEPK